MRPGLDGVVIPEDYAQMMQPYKGLFINGQAKMVHPSSSKSYPAGAVYRPGRLGSIVEVTRFELPSFTMEIGELADLMGSESQ
jgi:hypothetical protein